MLSFVFAGCAVLTLAVVFLMVLFTRLWDCKCGSEFDVISMGWTLFYLVEIGRLSHSYLGTPCQSVTFARRVPIRSFEWPRGFPNVAAWQQELLDSGNSLIAWSVLFLFHLDCHSCYGSMENPWPSYI